MLRLELKEKASGFRQKFGYAETDPIYLKSFLLKNNVITVFSDLGEGLSGMALKVQEDRFMLVNHGQSLGRQHFTIAHELYHLFVQENFVSRKCVTGLFSNQKDLEEKKADLFAANLLLPETGMLNLIPIAERSGKISEQTIFKIQQYYSVSVKAVIFRLFAMGLVDKSYFNAFSCGLEVVGNWISFIPENKNMASRFAWIVLLFRSSSKTMSNIKTLPSYSSFNKDILSALNKWISTSASNNIFGCNALFSPIISSLQRVDIDRV